jgi:hypothetical protein
MCWKWGFLLLIEFGHLLGQLGSTLRLIRLLRQSSQHLIGSFRRRLFILTVLSYWLQFRCFCASVTSHFIFWAYFEFNDKIQVRIDSNWCLFIFVILSLLDDLHVIEILNLQSAKLYGMNCHASFHFWLVIWTRILARISISLFLPMKKVDQWHSITLPQYYLQYIWKQETEGTWTTRIRTKICQCERKKIKIKSFISIQSESHYYVP